MEGCERLCCYVVAMLHRSSGTLISRLQQGRGCRSIATSLHRSEDPSNFDQDSGLIIGSSREAKKVLDSMVTRGASQRGLGVAALPHRRFGVENPLVVTI